MTSVTFAARLPILLSISEPDGRWSTVASNERAARDHAGVAVESKV